MTPDEDGLPRVAASGRGLGIRVPEDVRPDGEGIVRPGTGGMSVAPGSPWNLPHHRRPRTLGRGSTGPSGDHVFGIDLPPLDAAGLGIRPDPGRPVKHAFVEPRDPVLVEELRRRVASTRPSWRRVRP